MFFGICAMYMFICAIGVKFVIKQNVIIFNLAQTIDYKNEDGSAEEEEFRPLGS